MTAPSAALRNAIDEADYLLKHVAERKGMPPADLVDAIESARAACESGSIDARQENAFWNVYSQLSKRASPTTVESLRFITNMKDRKTPMGRALRWLRRYTAVVFVVLMATQIYWTVVSSLVSDVDRMNTEIRSIVQSSRYVNASDEERPKTDLAIRLEQLIRQAWGVYENLYCVVPSSIGVSCQWMRGGDTRRTEILSILGIYEAYDKTMAAAMVNDSRDFIEQNARLMLQIISTYFLPLLYGTLGAAVYVLRRFIAQLERLTFTEASYRRYRIRLMLGAIFGLAIGVMCTTPQSTTLFGSYSPFFLSFLAGYSVEGVFSALDSAIRSLRNRLHSNSEAEDTAHAPPGAPRPGGTPPKNGNGPTVVHSAMARGRVANGARGEAAE